MIIGDVVIEHAPNPYFDEPCPSCGDPFDVARDCLIGVALHGRARLCTACINTVMPEATKTLELVADLQCLLEESTDKAAFITSSVALLNTAINHLLIPAIPQPDPPRPKPIRRKRSTT